MAEVDDLRPGGLDEPSHHVDGGVVAVKEGRRGDDANRAGAGFEHDVVFVLAHGASMHRWFMKCRWASIARTRSCCFHAPLTHMLLVSLCCAQPGRASPMHRLTMG